ncbi:MAG TPA: glycosyltransferase family 9 protein [Rhizomicrobium sp.]|nr:glycosyltransferase family 9 protein [Rhizomicrobium sp.]
MNLKIARALGRLGRESAALQILSLAATRDDPRQRRHWELAKHLLRQEQTLPAASRALATAALGVASQSVESVIRLNAAISLARLLFEDGQYTESLSAADLALSVSPADSRALRARANALIALGQIGKGRQIYAQIVANDPDSAEARTKLRALEALPDEHTRMSAWPALGNSAGLLIGVGGGIGDILHATPMIRNISRRTGKKVDVVVFADHRDAEFLVRNPNYVDNVSPICPEVLERVYETVLLCHSFGPLRFDFNTERTVTSRDWRPFRAGDLPETLFNLEAARALLGIPYDESDVNEYFIGELEWRRPKETLVGIHAGSKAGRWISKRWPHFPELSDRLGRRGIPVASFGTRDEYVAGTEDRTGGSIEEMCRSILECSHFISNDSGPMHIASALGIPVLALFAPTDPLTHLPLRTTTLGLSLQKPCAPCEVRNHRYFASGACRCVAEIGVEIVERKVLEMVALKEQPRSERGTAGGRA